MKECAPKFLLSNLSYYFVYFILLLLKIFYNFKEDNSDILLNMPLLLLNSLVRRTCRRLGIANSRIKIRLSEFWAAAIGLKIVFGRVLWRHNT